MSIKMKRNPECDATKEQIEDALCCSVIFEGEFVEFLDLTDPDDWVIDAAIAEGFVV